LEGDRYVRDRPHVMPFQGMDRLGDLIPRALPWAFMCQPFGLDMETR